MRWDSSYALGKAYLELGDEAAARQAFRQLDSQIDTFLQNGGWIRSVGSAILYALGKAYLELGDEAAARRVFTMREARFYTHPEVNHPHVGDEILYAFGKAYSDSWAMKLPPRRVFTKLEELINNLPASLVSLC